MIFDWLVRRSSLYRDAQARLASEAAAHGAQVVAMEAVQCGLEAAVERERQLAMEAKAEVVSTRAECRKLYEYIAITDRKPRFDVTEKRESKPPIIEAKSYGQILKEREAAEARRFSEWLESHPEEKDKLGEDYVS